MKKQKIILTILIIVIFMTLSIIVMIKTLSNPNNKNQDNTEVDIVIKDGDVTNNKELEKVLEEQLNNENYLSDKFPLLSKYSEKYISVAEWIIAQLIEEWDTNGFTVINENGEEVDGLTIYKDASEYMTYLLNNEADIEDYFFMYCEDKYTELRYVYLLGSDSNNEYDASSSSVLYTTLLDLYETEQYQEIIDKVDSLLLNYKFTLPYNYPICNLYQDALLSLDYGTNTDAINYGLDHMNSIETYFINFMKITDKQKMVLLHDNQSLVPIKGTLIDIINVEDVDLEDTSNSWISSKFYDYTRNAKSVTKISYKEYNRDDQQYYKCIAYIANYFDRTKQVLTIQWDDSAKCYLHTLKEYYDVYNVDYEWKDTGTDGYWNTTNSEKNEISNNEVDSSNDVETNKNVDDSNANKEKNNTTIIEEEIIDNEE